MGQGEGGNEWMQVIPQTGVSWIHFVAGGVRGGGNATKPFVTSPLAISEPGPLSHFPPGVLLAQRSIMVSASCRSQAGSFWPSPRPQPTPPVSQFVPAPPGHAPRAPSAWTGDLASAF